MALDVELYRRTVYASVGTHAQSLRRLSIIDIEPEGATRTLVFIHGYGGNSSQWIYQLRFFGQSMRVIAPDMRGHGLSDDPDAYSMSALVDDVELLVRALHVQKPFYVIGHSFGGAIASEYTLRHPEDVHGLVLIGVPTRFLLHPFVRRLMNIPDPLFSLLAKRLKIDLHAPQRTLKRMHDDIMAVWHGDERVRALHVPTLVVLGQRDTVFLREHYEDVSRSIRGAQQVVIPVSAHLVQLERPDAVNRVIRRLIDPKPISIKAPPAQMTASLHISRFFEMPWLHHYDSEVPEQVPLPKQLLHDMLTSAAREFPNRPAIIFFGQKISYHELEALSNRFAHALRALGVQKGDRVGIVLPNIPQSIIAFYGTLKAGAVAVLGSPLSSEEEVALQLRDSGAKVLLTLTSYREKIGALCSQTALQYVIYTDVREYLPLRQRLQLARRIDDAGGRSAPTSGIPSSAHTPPRRRARYVPSSLLSEARHGSVVAGWLSKKRMSAPIPPTATTSAITTYSFQQLLHDQSTSPLTDVILRFAQDLALIQYTSGTTDSPKGVMLTHRNLTVNVIQVRHWMLDARRGREVILCVLPLSHSYGITSCMNLSIGLAASLVLLPTTRTNEILEAIKHYHPTIFPGVPALYLAIANYPKVRRYGVASIRICVSGSAPLPIEVQEAFEKLTHGRLVEGYGLTEASPVTHSNPLKGERRVGSIGMPLPSTHARIVDWNTGQPLPIGEVGELVIRGPQVMQGYWKMPEETGDVMQDGWLHTGDLASMDEDGFFTIIDRKKDLILSGPYNVFPRDVEEVLYEHPKVLEAAVVCAPVPTAANGSARAQELGPSAEGSGARFDPSSLDVEALKASHKPQELSGASQSPFPRPLHEEYPCIKAVVVLKPGEKATADELLALCRARLDAYKVPRQIEFRSELPKNFVGKVLRRLLVE